MRAFKIVNTNTRNVGFSLTFPNGVTAVVRWGDLSCSDHGVTSAECTATIKSNNPNLGVSFVRVPGFDYEPDRSKYNSELLACVSADEVARFLAAVSKMPGPLIEGVETDKASKFWESIDRGYTVWIGVHPDSGTYCGYIMFPESSQFAGDTLQWIDVHGGITYEKWNNYKNGHFWIVGFDCNHSSDYSPTGRYGNPKSFKSVDFVKKELVHMVDQLVARESQLQKGYNGRL